MPKDFTAHNLKVLAKAIRDNSGKVTAYSDSVAMQIMERTADEILRWVEGKQYTYEDQTYNLTDSIGCAIYKHGVLVKIVVPQTHAVEPREYTYHKLKHDEYGRGHLRAVLNDFEIASMGDYVLGIFAAAPYGLWVDLSLGYGGPDKRGKGWFSEDLKTFAEEQFNRVKNEFINN